MACQAFALGAADDSLVAAILLHDVVELSGGKLSYQIHGLLNAYKHFL